MSRVKKLHVNGGREGENRTEFIKKVMKTRVEVDGRRGQVKSDGGGMLPG